MKRILWTTVLVSGFLAIPGNAQRIDFERLTPRPAVLSPADLRLPDSRMLPLGETYFPTYRHVIFSGSVAGIPKNEGLDRLTAPPFTAVLLQSFALIDRSNGAIYCDGQTSGSASVISPAALVWEPGRATISTDTSIGHLRVEQTALRTPQGFVLRVWVHNPGRNKRSVVLATLQQPTIRRPREWTYAEQFPANVALPVPARADGDIVVHDNGDGAVAFALAGASAVAAPSRKAALDLAVENKSGGEGAASALYRSIELAPGDSRTFFVVIAIATSHAAVLDAVRQVMVDPTVATEKAREQMENDIRNWLTRLPALSHTDSRVVRFYQHAALQLLYDRWKVGGTFILDPWYPTVGLDSGGMNSYAWDIDYAAIPFALLDPAGMRSMLVAQLGAPLTEHYSIEPLRGEGTGPFYAYSPYAFTSAVDKYIRATGDRSILRERIKGKTVLEWLITLAQFGEEDRDPDHSHLLDYGDDHSLLEIKTTGNGPGYIHQVPSPNAERSFVYETLADILEEEHDTEHAALVPRFRQQAAEVRRAINQILWVEDIGWYGTRQKNGKVVPVYSIQVFDLLRIPDVAPPERAKRLVAHLNDDEFLGPWGPRSLSMKDRLWDWRDHDWSGPMTYIGDGPQLVADLYQAGFIEEAWKVLERILWWPEHLAVYPQGIANDDYSSRIPQSKSFGGRISAGRINEISGCVGVEAIIRGLFGVRPERDGSIGFSSGRRPQDGPMALAYPFRGRTWTVTQRREGIDVLRDDGFGATLLREDGSLWFRVTAQSAVVRVAARSGGPGRLIITGPGRHWRAVRIDGNPVVPVRTHGRLIFELPDLAGRGAELKMEK
jgi:hypothetical protein